MNKARTKIMEMSAENSTVKGGLPFLISMFGLSFLMFVSSLFGPVFSITGLRLFTFVTLGFSPLAK